MRIAFPTNAGVCVFRPDDFAELSEHVTLSGDSAVSWNGYQRIVSLATGAPAIECPWQGCFLGR